MTSFGRYELVSRLASGGMGEIWLAHLRGASGFEKRVVVKIMLPHVAENPKLVDMFVTEASVAAQLSHPNIIQIYELGVVGGRYFIAMEYVAGRSLRQIGHRLRQQSRPMPIWFLLAVIGKTCQGLHYAHELCDANGRPMGLAHRDVSPENIMVSFTGDVKLIDFGALRIATGNTHPASRKEDLIGKFSYMAPEQVRGVPASRRTDMYSVGEVLYEYLTGVRPFEAPDEASLLHKVSRGEIIDPGKLAPHLPGRLLDVLRQVLAFDPKVRWSDAADLAEALFDLLKQANLPFDQSSLGRFLATLFPEAPDVPKVVQQELTRRSLPSRDLTAERPTAPMRAAKRQLGDAEDSVQIEVEDFEDTPIESVEHASPPAPRASGRTMPPPLPSRSAAEPRRNRPSTPAVIAAALPPPAPTAPRPAPRVGVAAPEPVPTPEPAPEPESWPMASPIAAPPAAPPDLPAEGTGEHALDPAESGLPLFARGSWQARSPDQATSKLFDSVTPPRHAASSVEVFAARAPRPPAADVDAPAPRDVPSLFAGRPSFSPVEEAHAFHEELSPLGEPEDAVTRRAVRRPASEAEALFDRGLGLLRAHAFEAALTEWERALRLDPDNRKLRSNVSRLRKKLGRP